MAWEMLRKGKRACTVAWVSWGTSSKITSPLLANWPSATSWREILQLQGLVRVPFICLPKSSSTLPGESWLSVRWPLSISSMVAEKEAMGAPFSTVASGPTRLCTVPSRGMVTCMEGTATIAESAWVTK
ncbi:hypothetical protein D3C81_1636610 [compost metagenome]